MHEGWHYEVYGPSLNDSAECNFSRLVSPEGGSTVVPTYDWTAFFAPD